MGNLKTKASVFVISALLAAGVSANAVETAPILAVGIDTKFGFDDRGGRVFKPDTGDSIQFFDLTNPAAPKLIGGVPMTNSVVGPPTNLAIAPDGKWALVANSIRTEAGTDGVWKSVPDNKVFLIDLVSRPIRIKQTIEVGVQPSGLAIRADGAMAIVANRAGKSVSVLKIVDGEVAVTDTIPMDEAATSVAFTPDGRRALVDIYGAHKVTILDIDGDHARPTGRSVPVGLWPYTVTVTLDGHYGLAGITGNQAASDGNLDPIAVIDLQATPPRTVDYVTAGDSVEGLVVSPKGGYVAATILQGSLDAPKDAWYRHEHGKVLLLRQTDQGVQVVNGVEVGAFPEGVAFSPDGEWIYAGNFGSNSLSVLHLDHGRLVNTNADIALPGPAASLRVGSQ